MNDLMRVYSHYLFYFALNSAGFGSWEPLLVSCLNKGAS